MNEWIGIGRLTKDPELSYTQSNHARCTFTLAIDRPKSNGENQGADFIRIVVWNKQAETCERYLKKGDRCAVKGAIRTGSYKNKVGVTVYTTDIWAERVEFLNSRQQSGYQSPQEQYQSANNDYHNDEYNSAQGNFSLSPSFDDLPDTFSAAEDDIPF